MDDLKRNGSGYYDPTAYKAIRKFQNGGVTMEVYRGDIFYIEDNYRTEGSEHKKLFVLPISPPVPKILKEDRLAFSNLS